MKLVTPPRGTVLDCFAGSGTGAIAADREGFGFIGIEAEAAYIEIARARWQQDAPLFNREPAA
jgi:site-specific DNA-methyltransferase (adenine-specific)